jgi:hypothetical protein
MFVLLDAGGGTGRVTCFFGLLALFFELTYSAGTNPAAPRTITMPKQINVQCRVVTTICFFLDDDGLSLFY